MTARTNTAARSSAAAADTVTDVKAKAKTTTKARARRVFPEATARVVTPDAIVPESVSELKATITEDMAEEAALHQRLAAEVQELWGKLSFPKIEISTRAKTILLVIAKVMMYAIGAVATACLVGALSTFLQAAGWHLFIVAVVELTTFILGCIASWYASDAVINFVASGGVKRNVDRAFGRVGSFFKGRAGDKLTAA